MTQNTLGNSTPYCPPFTTHTWQAGCVYIHLFLNVIHPLKVLKYKSPEIFTSLFTRFLIFLVFKIKNFVPNSDGGGRSGVYLAIDANLELAEEEDCFDVFGFLKKLRQSRKGLIENEVR